MTSIAIADSSPVFRYGMVNIVKQLNHVQLVGEACDEVEILGLARSFHPQIVIVDFLANGFTVDTLVQLKQLSKPPRIIAVTDSESGHTIVNALRAGVDSYIKKACSIQEVQDAILETAVGATFFCGQILDAIRKESIDVTDLKIAEFTCHPISLTERENEILTLIAEGYTNSAIATRLFLSNHTVNTHRKNMMNKLGVNNTAALVMYAVKSGMVSPNKFLFQAGN
ncbi:MAG: LuxR C-terminal-related transcriptional regulator [Flavobacteriales bacterium]